VIKDYKNNSLIGYNYKYSDNESDFPEKLKLYLKEKRLQKKIDSDEIIQFAIWNEGLIHSFTYFLFLTNKGIFKKGSMIDNIIRYSELEKIEISNSTNLEMFYKSHLIKEKWISSLYLFNPLLNVDPNKELILLVINEIFNQFDSYQKNVVSNNTIEEKTINNFDIFSLVDDLEKIYQLNRQNILTDEEANQQKIKLLTKIN